MDPFHLSLKHLGSFRHIFIFIFVFSGACLFAEMATSADGDLGKNALAARILVVSTPTATATSTPALTLRVWPNPYNPNSGTGYFYAGFAGVGTTMSIYTASGEPVMLDLQSVSGTITWDGRNKNGAKVSSGLYVYLIRDGKTVLLHGKLLVIAGK
jgi:hypothetical protein